MRTDIIDYLNWSYFQMLCQIHLAPELTVMVSVVVVVVLCHLFYGPVWIFVAIAVDAGADVVVVVRMLSAVGGVQSAPE